MWQWKREKKKRVRLKENDNEEHWSLMDFVELPAYCTEQTYVYFWTTSLVQSLSSPEKHKQIHIKHSANNFTTCLKIKNKRIVYCRNSTSWGKSNTGTMTTDYGSTKLILIVFYLSQTSKIHTWFKLTLLSWYDI